MVHRYGLACMAVMVSACTLGPEPRQAPDRVSLTGTTSFPPDLGRGAARVEGDATMLYVPLEIGHTCAGMDPTFSYDSAGVASDDNRSLRVLADCMKTGALANKTLRLVGHADARGSDPYNDRLGKQRAEAVKLYLMKTGIPSERLITDTEGKRGAAEPPKDWDRRVDFEIVSL